MLPARWGYPQEDFRFRPDALRARCRSKLSPTTQTATLIPGTGVPAYKPKAQPLLLWQCPMAAVVSYLQGSPCAAVPGVAYLAAKTLIRMDLQAVVSPLRSCSSHALKTRCRFCCLTACCMRLSFSCALCRASLVVPRSLFWVVDSLSPARLPSEHPQDGGPSRPLVDPSCKRASQVPEMSLLPRLLHCNVARPSRC